MLVIDAIHIEFQEAKIKHLLFKSRLRAILYDEKVEDVAPVVFHYECLVGKWLYSRALSEYAHIQEIHELELVHTQLHAIARNLVDLYNEGHVDAARAGLQKVEEVAGEFITLLEIAEDKACSKTFSIHRPKKKDNIDISKADIFYELVRKNEILDKVIKKQASELVISQYMLNNFFLQAPGFFFVLKGPRYKFELVNDSFLNLIKKKCVMGMSIHEALPELKRQEFFELLDHVYHTQNTYTGSEIEVFLDKGIGNKEPTYVDFVCHPMINSNKEVEGIMAFGYDVTDQVNIRKKIKESEKHFRDLVMHSPIPMGVVRGKDYVIDLANEALLKGIWKREFTKVQGKKLFEVFPELKQQKFHKVLDEVYQSGVAYRDKDCLAYVNDGVGLQKFYLDYEYSPLVENDTVTGIVITVVDVTKSIESRNHIKELELRSRLAIECSAMGTFEWNLLTDEFISSPRLNEIFGYKDKEVSHRDLINAVHPSDRIIREKALADSTQNGTLAYEVRIIWQDQSIHWIRVDGKTYYDDIGVPTRLYGAVMETTEQKYIINDLKESEEKFRLLADSMPQLIWTSDQNGNLNYFNQAVYDYSGLSNDKLMEEGWFNNIHPDDRQQNAELWKYAVENGTEFSFEHRFKKYTGEYRWQLSRATPQKDKFGNIQMWVGASTDIQDHKSFQHLLEEKVKDRTQSLIEANNNLERSNKELQQFAYVASHDLQEPIRKITTFSNIIRQKYSEALPEDSIAYLDKITSSSKRMSRLIEDLLNFSRITGNAEVYAETDLNEILQIALADFEEFISEKKAIIIVEPLPVIMANTMQMTQLFHNIIGNSLKFSHENQPPVIKISGRMLSEAEATEYKMLSRRKKYIRLIFEDNGIGFNPEYSKRIFTIFQRLNDRTAYKGTGIGLALCKKIVDNHEGYIIATGVPDLGATFTIFLPV